MRTSPVRMPVGLAVEAVPEGEIGIQPRTIRPLVALCEVERVLHVVEIANLEVAVHRIELLRRQHQVLYLGPSHAFDAYGELAPRQGLRHHPEQLPATQHLLAI